MQAAPTQPKDVINTMKSIGVLPVFHNADVNTILQMIRTSYRNGIHVFEFLHQRDNRGLRIFSWLVEQTADLPDLKLGAGTVLDAVMTGRYIDAGAKFIASPFLRKDMAEVCIRSNTLWIPGCSNRADIVLALEYGATAVMILPGNILTTEFLRKAVVDFTGLHFIPSGGFDSTESSLQSWLNAGALSVRLGDSLFEREALAAGDLARVEHNVQRVVNIIKKIKTPGRKNSSPNIA